MKDIIVSGYPGKLAKAVIKELQIAPELGGFTGVGLQKPSVSMYQWGDTQIAAVINCIGAYQKASVLLPYAWDSMLDSNLRAPLNVIMSALPHMNRGGLIINVTALAAGLSPLLAKLGDGPYVGSKLALSAATASLRAELEPAGIEVEEWQAPTMDSPSDGYRWEARKIVARVIRTLVK